MCNTLNIKALELYCNIKKWNIELDTLLVYITDIQVHGIKDGFVGSGEVVYPRTIPKLGICEKLETTKKHTEIFKI